MIKRYLLTTLLIISTGAAAGELVCSGKVKALAYHADNKLMIQLESMNTPVFFCSPDAIWSVNGTSYTTGPETCKTLYSTFLSAQMAGKTLNSVYFDGNDVPTSCSGWQSWKSANIRHFSIQ